MSKVGTDERFLTVGPAKSGTTALTYAVAAAIQATTVMFEEPPEMLVRLPAGGVAKVLYDHFDEQRLLRGAAFVSHRMLLVRDPRDLFISRLLYVVSSRREWLGDEALMHRLLRMLWDKQQSPEDVNLLDVGALLFGDRQEAVCRLMGPIERYAGFLSAQHQNWCVVRYEDFVAGELASLESYLDRPVGHRPTIDPQYRRVARSCSSGNWRHWLSSDDLCHLRQDFAPLVEVFGYGDDWESASAPQILPAHSWGYMTSLIEERRCFFGLPSLTLPEWLLAARGQRPCSICGALCFDAGPRGRRALNGSLPHCRQCGSLERHRAMFAVAQALSASGPVKPRMLYVSEAPLPGAALWGSPRQVARACAVEGESRQDLIVLDHGLELARDDVADFATLAGCLNDGGVIVADLGNPLGKPRTVEVRQAEGVYGGPRHYGLDVAQRLRCNELGLSMRVLVVADPGTDTELALHVFSRGEHVQHSLGLKFASIIDGRIVAAPV
ncbi:MAG: hypothetical protein EKK49_12955 [Rhodocyclaceae bacterium]|nr:MAG: hypothetical protein EKK49_12955 [Rhodocyclaceae bacterium]